MGVVTRIKSNGDLQLKGEVYEFPEVLRGGRNLVSNGTFIDGLTNWILGRYGSVLPAEADAPDNPILQLECTRAAADPDIQSPLYNSKRMYLKGGETITLSFDFFCEDVSVSPPGSIFTIRRFDTDISSAYTDVLISLSVRLYAIKYNEWNNSLTYTYTVPANLEGWAAVGVYMSNSGVGARTSRYKYRRIKVEKLLTNSKWTPAPEDLGLTYPNWIQNFTESFNENGIVAGEIVEFPASQKSNRNLLLDSNREVVGGTREFIQFADIAPIFDKYGLRQYTISFDIKSKDVSKKNTIQVYCQNGSNSKYSISSKNITVTTEYQRTSITVVPTIQSATEQKALLAFFGQYDTGNVPIVRNVKVELGDKMTPYITAPEDSGFAYPEWVQSFGNPISIIGGKGILIAGNLEEGVIL